MAVANKVKNIIINPSTFVMSPLAACLTLDPFPDVECFVAVQTWLRIGGKLFLLLAAGRFPFGMVFGP